MGRLYVIVLLGMLRRSLQLITTYGSAAIFLNTHRVRATPEIIADISPLQSYYLSGRLGQPDSFSRSPKRRQDLGGVYRLTEEPRNNPIADP